MRLIRRIDGHPWREVNMVLVNTDTVNTGTVNTDTGRHRACELNLLRAIVLAVMLLHLHSTALDAATPSADGKADALIGRQIEDFTLQDFRGKSHSLSALSESKLVVAYFMGTDCPLARLYGPRMQKLYERFSRNDVVLLGINSNTQDSITELAAHARIHGITFPLLKDVGNKVADQFGATRTPQVFVLDERRKIRYHGRVDAQFTFGSGVGLAQPQEQRRDLVLALEELLAGKDVSVSVTEAKGCLIGRVRQPDQTSEVTYSNQIARLIQARCLECHREGQIAPFAMTDYDEVAGWGEMIAEVVREQRMPPWHANPKYGKFANENRLTDEEKQLIYTWVEKGCPEGDSSNLPAPRKFHEGWFLPREPDQIIYISDKPVSVKAEGIEEYRHYEVDPGFTEDKWVRLAECMPDNRAVVHHITVHIKDPNAERGRGGRGIGRHSLLVGYAPGSRPKVAPEGWARKIPAGSKLIFQVHYTPIGGKQTDRSGVGLIFMDEKDVTHRTWTTNLLNHDFVIPAHESRYKVEAEKTFQRDVTLLSMFPHMHMRGSSFRYELTYPDGKREILLDVPHYDFNWQNSFLLAEPKLIPKGSKMLCTAYFDNSEGNLANPDPSKTVRWGDQTWEEMMIGWHDVAVPVN